MSMKSYERYRDSSLDWVSVVPEHWKVKKLKHVSDVNLSNVDKKSIKGEKEVLLCNYVDVYYNDVITDAIEFMRATAKYEQINRFKLKRNDVIITKDSESPTDIAVPTWVSKDFDDVLCGYHLALLRPNDQINGKYLFYTLQSQAINQQFHAKANGVTRFAIGKNTIKNAMVLIPPLLEQEKIAKWLDESLSNIDEIVSKKKQQIEILKQYHQSLITETVTRGLNSDVKMKDSGVEWLGEIPEHWNIKKIKHFTNHIGSGKTPRGGGEIYVDEGVLFLRSQNIHKDSLRLDDVVYIPKEIDNKMANSRVKNNDILMNITGASIGRANVYKLDIPANVSQHVCIIRVKEEKISPDYLNYVIASSYFQSQIMAYQNGASKEGLNFSQISNISFIVPRNIEEQNSIVDFLNMKISQIESIRKLMLQQIESFQQYRQSLIYEVVTGKIDVRNYVSNEQEMT
ncbi:restriction endonuclease subunit S [Bacillus sp. N1-1]|uniref:restriction endonuclease subunit S n=1 Tax=Bacillus sp. N1-1 TaxID=2682541 RepID=UPI001316804C|nr:restriction endonuclease subunit S [Bacillus sp. N1-1]QHA90168.1 restriction endonuclease subunit S [Bacillus sp. N1-1]